MHRDVFFCCTNRELPNNGEQGFVNPYLEEYDLLFERDQEGRIIPQQDLAKQMYKNLHLGLKRHSLIWQLEKIDATLDVLEIEYPKVESAQTRDKITTLLFQFRQKVTTLRIKRRSLKKNIENEITSTFCITFKRN